MKQKTEKNPKGAGRNQSAPTKPIFIRVPLGNYEELNSLCRKLVRNFFKSNNLKIPIYVEPAYVEDRST